MTTYQVIDRDAPFITGKIAGEFNDYGTAGNLIDELSKKNGKLGRYYINTVRDTEPVKLYSQTLAGMAEEDLITINAVPCKTPRTQDASPYTNWFHVKLMREGYPTFSFDCGFGTALPAPDPASVLEILLSEAETFNEKDYEEYLDDYGLEDTPNEQKNWRQLGKRTGQLNDFLGTRGQSYAEAYAETYQ